MFRPVTVRHFSFLSRLFSPKKRPKVFLDITIEGQPRGKLIIELFNDKVPRTAENFLRLCVGDAGFAESRKVLLHYRGTPFHRIIPGFMCQGGDIIRKDGGESIYGTTFPDENFKVSHDKLGIVSMANVGPDTNSSQFFITTVACKQLDGGYVAFGQVVDGLEVLGEIDKCGMKIDSGTPTRRVVISDCGEVKEEEQKEKEKEKRDEKQKEKENKDEGQKDKEPEK